MENLRILLAEDNEHDVRVFKRAMREFDRPFSLTHCHKGEEALGYLRENPEGIDILISDYNMPGMTGLDLCRDLLKSGVSFPMILLTGSGDEKIAARALRLGVDDYIIKDPDGGYRELLANTLTSVLQNHAERKARVAAEIALREAHDNLERRVRERTEDLAKANAQLRQEMRERRSAEESMRKSRDELRLIADNMPALIAKFDQDRNFLFANKTAERWYARPARDLLGKSLKELFDVGTYEKLMPRMEKVLTGVPVQYEEEMLYPDGETRQVEITTLPEVSGEGAVTGWFSLSVDVTQRKRDEAQLRQYQKMEAVGQLTGGVAHDFNNLMGIVVGHADMLLDRVGDENEHLQGIMRAAFRGGELTQRLLAFSRKQSLIPKIIDLNEQVTDLMTLLGRTLGDNIRIDVKEEAALWKTAADPGQVENAVLNLAINAQHAMPNGGTIRIETKNVVLDESYLKDHDGAVPGDYVMLAVQDSGAGMPPDVLARVFEPFFTTKDAGVGTGLGLSMVYGFAKQSGGYVAIESEPGVGTIARLYLPRVEQETEVRIDALDTVIPLGSGETVLIVEDNPDVLTLTVALVEGLGYRTLQAPNADAALDLLDSGTRIEVLLSDILLPGPINGAELAEIWSQKAPGLGVLFMSGYANDSIYEGVRVDESASLLRKPFHKRDLAVALRTALDENPS